MSDTPEQIQAGEHPPLPPQEEEGWEPIPPYEKPKGPALIWRGVLFGVGAAVLGIAALWLSPIFFLALPLWLIFATMLYVAFQRHPLWHFLPFLVPVLAAAYWAWDPFASLPAGSDVQAAVFLPGKDEPELPLSAKQTEQLLAALRPAYREWNSAKWTERGRFRLTLKEGEKVEIVWFQDETTDCATFSVLPNHGPPHYRGGTRAEVEKLVTEVKAK
jgi:hypothetical protein